MATERKSDIRQLKLPPEGSRVRRLQRISARHGLKLEALLAGAISVNILVGQLVGHQTISPPIHHPVASVEGTFFVLNFLGIAALGGLVLTNTLAPMIRVEGGQWNLDSDRFRSRPHWYQGLRLLQSTCGVLLVVFAPITLLAATPAIYPMVYGEDTSGTVLLTILVIIFTLMVLALLVLVLTIFSHVYARGYQIARERIR